jgi:TRAP-type C4-dicarboxylate transport system substrate-binding protein
MGTALSRPTGGSTGTNFNPKVHLKNYPTFDKLERRLEEFMDEVAEELKQEFLDDAAEQTEELIHEIGK